MRYIILGSGIAGYQAAVTLAKEDPQGEVVLLTQDAEPAYFRPRLIDYLAGRVDFSKTLLLPREKYAEKGIDLRLNSPVSSVDGPAKRVILESGETLTGDKILLATGARSFVPPIPGRDLPGVFTFRDKPDADRILASCRPGRAAAVVGGGLLGLETAFSLAEQGMEVSVVEFFDRLLPRQLDEDGASILQGLLQEKGLRFYLGEKTEAFLGGAEPGEGGLRELALASGKSVPADLAVVSTGVRSRLELLESAGVEIDKAAVVNDRMETSVPGIYAAGDSAVHRGSFYGLWMPAREQGTAAGKAMAGRDEPYEGTPREARLKITGISLFSAGEDGEMQGDEGTTSVWTVREEGLYRKAVVRDVGGDRTLTGGIVLGDEKGARLMSQVLAGRKPLEELESLFPDSKTS